MSGDCFEVAGRLIAFDKEFADGVLCHGTPIGRGKANGGRRYWHAWVEVGETVYDRSNGMDVAMPRFVYYAIGNIDPETVTRYTAREAREWMRLVEHFGPWENDDDPTVLHG